jgi:fibronectin type 3 domain-containing protein
MLAMPLSNVFAADVAVWEYKNWIAVPYEKLTYPFGGNPIAITSYKITVLSGGGNSSTLMLYDEKGNLLSSSFLLRSSSTTVSGKVSKLEVRNAESVKLVIDVSLYGTPPTNTDSSLFIINNLEKKMDSATSISLTWSPINSIYLKKYNVYQDDILIGTVSNNSLNVSGLVPGQIYNFKVTPVDTFNKEFSGSELVYEVPLPDTTPPGIPKKLKVVPDRYTASLSWDAPSDPDLLGYYIYLDDNRVNSTPQLNNNYVVTGLSIDSDYKIDVTAVDMSGNISDHSAPLYFRTLTLQTVPAPPGNLIVNSFYKGANLNWLPSSSAKEYIVYMDGEQLFKTVQTSAKVTNLTNGKNYSFEVTAMNEIGESDKTGPVVVTPSESSPVDVTLGYSLKDISDGTANMFSAQWLLLAFAIAIPLSFFISNRVKGLFIS